MLAEYLTLQKPWQQLTELLQALWQEQSVSTKSQEVWQWENVSVQVQENVLQALTQVYLTEILGQSEALFNSCKGVMPSGLKQNLAHYAYQLENDEHASCPLQKRVSNQIFELFEHLNNNAQIGLWLLENQVLPNHIPSPQQLFNELSSMSVCAKWIYEEDKSLDKFFLGLLDTRVQAGGLPSKSGSEKVQWLKAYLYQKIKSLMQEKQIDLWDLYEKKENASAGLSAQSDEAQYVALNEMFLFKRHMYYRQAKDLFEKNTDLFLNQVYQLNQSKQSEALDKQALEQMKNLPAYKVLDCLFNPNQPIGFPLGPMRQSKLLYDALSLLDQNNEQKQSCIKNIQETLLRGLDFNIWQDPHQQCLIGLISKDSQWQKQLELLDLEYINGLFKKLTQNSWNNLFEYMRTGALFDLKKQNTQNQAFILSCFFMYHNGRQWVDQAGMKVMDLIDESMLMHLKDDILYHLLCAPRPSESIEGMLYWAKQYDPEGYQGFEVPKTNIEQGQALLQILLQKDEWTKKIMQMEPLQPQGVVRLMEHVGYYLEDVCQGQVLGYLVDKNGKKPTAQKLNDQLLHEGLTEWVALTFKGKEPEVLMFWQKIIEVHEKNSKNNQLSSVLETIKSHIQWIYLQSNTNQQIPNDTNKVLQVGDLLAVKNNSNFSL